MRIRIHLAKEQTATGELFRTGVAEGKPRAFSFFASFVMHGLLAASIWLTTYAPLPMPQVNPNPPVREIRIGNRLYYVAQLPAAVSLQSRGRNFASKPDVRSSHSAARAFSLPPASRKPLSHQTLIQPGMPSDIAIPDVTLPTFVIWTGTESLAPFHRPFVAPGEAGRPTIAAGPIIEPPPDLAASQAVIPGGEPLNIVSLNPLPLPFPERLLVPEGNLLPAGTSPVADPAEALAKLRPSIEAALAAAAAVGDEPGSPKGPVSASAAAIEPRILALSSPPPAPKIIDLPPDGKFDSVILHSSPIPFGEGQILSGRPVYTVYISAGASTEWTLYFCLPGEAATPSASPVVHLESGAVLRPPWPFHLVVPAIAPVAWDTQILVHAFVTIAGRLEALTLVDPPLAEENPALLDSLSAWQFRPAAKDGVPVRVEALLVIPAGSF